jgi:hypothetical protein
LRTKPRTFPFTYAPLTSTAVYSKDTTANYPLQDVQAPLYVVSRVDTSSGLRGTYSSSYSYAGAKAALSGRGFLGFRQMAANDLQTSIVDTTTYRQDFPYLGLVASTTRSYGTQTLGASTNTYQFSNASGSTTISPASAPYEVSLSQNVSSGSELGAACGDDGEPVRCVWQRDAGRGLDAGRFRQEHDQYRRLVSRRRRSPSCSAYRVRRSMIFLRKGKR